MDEVLTSLKMDPQNTEEFEMVSQIINESLADDTFCVNGKAASIKKIAKIVKSKL